MRKEKEKDTLFFSSLEFLMHIPILQLPHELLFYLFIGSFLQCSLTCLPCARHKAELSSTVRVCPNNLRGGHCYLVYTRANGATEKLNDFPTHPSSQMWQPACEPSLSSSPPPRRQTYTYCLPCPVHSAIIFTRNLPLLFPGEEALPPPIIHIF